VPKTIKKPRLLDQNLSDAQSAVAILHAEANATLNLAEEQLQKNLVEDAVKNYHTASIYFRVLSSLDKQQGNLPDAELEANLAYSLTRTREFSYTLQNCVKEHFSGMISYTVLHFLCVLYLVFLDPSTIYLVIM
jgi:hypothetical protein